MFGRKKEENKEKAEMLEYIKELQKKFDCQVDEAVKNMEELDQEKLYFCFAKSEDISYLKQSLMEVKKRMRWSVPNIIFISDSVRIDEVTEESLKKLLVERRAKKDDKSDVSVCDKT